MLKMRTRLTVGAFLEDFVRTEAETTQPKTVEIITVQNFVGIITSQMSKSCPINKAACDHPDRMNNLTLSSHQGPHLLAAWRVTILQANSLTPTAKLSSPTALTLTPRQNCSIC